MSSKDSKINPDVVVKLMGKTIKTFVDKKTGRGKTVSTAEALKPTAENKNRRGVLVIKNIKNILEDEKKLTRLRERTENIIMNNPRTIQADIIKILVKSLDEDTSMFEGPGLDEILSDRLYNNVRNAEGVESKEEKEKEVKTQKPLDVIDINTSTEKLKSWLESNKSKYYEAINSEGEDQERIRTYYEQIYEEHTRRKLRENMEKEDTKTIEKLETEGVLSSRPLTKPSKEKVKVSEPSIAQRTKDEDDEPQIIMTQPKIKGLPIIRTNVNRIESSTFFAKLMNEISSTRTYLNFEPGYLTELFERGINSLPPNYRRILEPILEGARGGGTIEIARGLTHLAVLYYVLPSLGFSSKDPLFSIVGNILSKTSDKIFDYMKKLPKEDISKLLKDDDKKPDKEIPEEPEEKQPDKKQPDKPDDKQPDKPDDKQPDDKPLTRRKRIVPSLIKAGGSLLAGGIAIAGASGLSYDATKEKPATAEPARPPPRDTLEDVVDLGTSGASAGIGAIALNEIRRQIVEARPETRPYIDSLGAEALTNLLGGILGYKAGGVIKEKTNIKEKIKEDIQQQLGIKETPITYNPTVLESSTATYAQKEIAKNRNWQPKTIMPSTSILDESTQEKYIDDLETSAFDYIAPTSEGSAGTIYTNPLKRQQYINERIRLEGAGMYLPYKTWGKINDPNEMSQEQLKLMLLGTELPVLQFEPMDNASTFENVQTVHLVNNEQDSIEMFSPYSQFSNVDNNWWTNEKSVLYTINP